VDVRRACRFDDAPFDAAPHESLIRCVKLKQRKRPKPIADLLQSLGVPAWRAWLLALSGKGWWRKAGSPQAQEGMTVAWFKKQGLASLADRYAALKP